LNQHALCCDCDECLNGTIGLVLVGAGVVRTVAEERGWFDQLRERRRRQMRDAHLRWQQRHPQLARAVKRRCWDRNRDQYNAARNAKRKAERAAARERTAA